MFAGVSTIGFLVGPLITTIIDPCLCRSIIGRSRSYCGFNLDSCLLLCLAVIVRVIEDDYLTVTKRPQDVAVEFARKLSSDFLIMRSISKNEKGSSIGIFPEALPCSNTREQGRRDEATDGDPSGGGDPDGAGVEFRRRRAKYFPLRRESVHAWCSLVLHRWLVDDKRGKNTKASKREGYEMIIDGR
jgi:hypothetical protein